MSKDKAYREAHTGHLVQVRSNGTRRVFMDFEGSPSMTEQSHKDSTDLQYILNQHIRSNKQIVIPESVYQDYSDLPDYQTCLNIVKGIDQIFDTLPLAARQAYDYDPAAFMRDVDDPSKRDHLVALGVFEASEADSVATDYVAPVVKDPKGSEEL